MLSLNVDMNLSFQQKKIRNSDPNPDSVARNDSFLPNRIPYVFLLLVYNFNDR